MLRVLFTSHFGGNAGSTYSILELLKGMQDAGHYVGLATPKSSLLSKLASDAGIRVFNVRLKGKIDLLSAYRLKRIVNEHDFKTVCSQGSKDRYIAIISKIVFQSPARIIITRRQRVKHNNPLKRWLHQTFSDMIVANSEGLKNLMLRKGFRDSHIQVVNNALPAGNYTKDEKIASNLRMEYGIQPGDKVIGCVSRLKRQDILLKLLKQMDPRWKILFVGITEQEVDNKWSIEYDRDKVIFAGQLERNLTLHHYQLMDCSVLASQMDGFGLVLIEAMKLGIPVIGSNYGGIPSVITDGVNGFLFDNQSSDSLLKKLHIILNDKNIRRIFVENGRLTADAFTLKKTVLGYESVFSDSLKKYG